jgi:hypothetical protein
LGQREDLFVLITKNKFWIEDSFDKHGIFSGEETYNHYLRKQSLVHGRNPQVAIRSRRRHLRCMKIRSRIP